MRVYLAFDLEKEEDKTAYLHAIKGADIYDVMWELDTALRGMVKYETKGKTKARFADEIRSMLHSFLADYNIDIYAN